MPVSENEYREPQFVKYQERYPISYNKNDRYLDTVVNPRVFEGRSHGGARTEWKAPGYNPNHNSTTLERVNLTTDSPSFRPY